MGGSVKLFAYLTAAAAAPAVRLLPRSALLLGSPPVSLRPFSRFLPSFSASVFLSSIRSVPLAASLARQNGRLRLEQGFHALQTGRRLLLVSERRGRGMKGEARQRKDDDAGGGMRPGQPAECQEPTRATGCGYCAQWEGSMTSPRSSPSGDTGTTRTSFFSHTHTYAAHGCTHAQPPNSRTVRRVLPGDAGKQYASKARKSTIRYHF